MRRRSLSDVIRFQQFRVVGRLTDSRLRVRSLLRFKRKRKCIDACNKCDRSLSVASYR